MRRRSHVRCLILTSVTSCLLLLLVYFWSTNAVLPETELHKQSYDPAERNYSLAGVVNSAPHERFSDIHQEDLVVPNLVHFVWLSFHSRVSNLTFLQYLSILSASRSIRPDRIYFHTDLPPRGHYWEQALRLPNFEVVHRNRTRVLFGEVVLEPLYDNQASDMERIKILSEYGGVYLDLDVLALRSFAPLRRHAMTLGLESSRVVCNAVIVASANAPALARWLRSFAFDFKVHIREYNAVWVPSEHFFNHRNYDIHFEDESLFRPNFKELDQLTSPDKKIPWRHKYTVHLWHYAWRWHATEAAILGGLNPESIKSLNSTIGEIARYIYYGQDAT